MNNYVNLLKSWVQTGQQMISSYSDGNKKAAVKIDKAAVIYNARDFDSSHLDTSKCIRTLTQLVYLFNKGEHFTEEEGTKLFFAITKLLQTDQPNLRRIVYVGIKQMRSHPSIYVFTASLTKDLHHKNASFRRNAVRIIPLIVDPHNLSQFERYIKELIVDPDQGVCSSALLSGLQIYQTNEELVKKWGTEILEKISAKDQYVQCHALMLIGDIKRKDPHAHKKILFSLTRQSLEGIAAVQYIRMLGQVAAGLQSDDPETKEFTNYLSRAIRHKDDMVQIEACRLACECSLVTNQQLLEVVKMLETFLASPSTVKKYAVLKIFNSLLRNQYRKNLIVNVKQIEKVLNGSNTSLSSIAASILLRICSENYLQTLFGRIEKTMSDMSQDYKKDVVQSLTNVLKTYPKQYALINNFLLNLMRKEDSCALKSEAIEVMSYEIREIGGQAKTECIRQLTRFLSSTHYHRIHFQILGIISREAGSQDVSSELFKNMISEIYLQEGAVRACGLSTLIHLSQHEHKQKEALQRTITSFNKDNSRQVRERLLFREKEKPISNYELDLIENYLTYNATEIEERGDSEALSMERMKKWGAEVGNNLIKKAKVSNREAEAEKVESDQFQTYRDIFEGHPTFSAYGPLRKINKSMLLSDQEGDLHVDLRLFLFDHSFIAEFQVKNNIPNTIMESLKIQLKHSGQTFEIAHIIPAKSIAYGHSAECFVGLRKTEECQDLIAEEKFEAIAKYTVKQVNGEVVKAQYQDEFSLQSFDIKLASYMAPWLFDPSDFPAEWQRMKGFEENGTFQLKYASTQAAEQELLRHFGLKKIQNLDNNSKGNMVAVNLAGRFLGSKAVLMVLMLAFDTKLGCLLKIKVKSEDEELTDDLISSIE